MATAGVLQLVFTTDVTGLSKGTKSARSDVGQLTVAVQQLDAGLGRMKGMLAGLVAGATGGGLLAFAKSGMDAVNSTRVLAERLGTSTDALSKLQYAAKLADVDSETLTGSLQKMQLRLAEVAMTGEGKAAGVLERFGLDAQTLAKQDPVSTFHQLLGVLEQIPNPAERMKVAVDVFGKQAQGILNLALQGSSGLADMEAEADQLGITISDIDAAKIDEADDAMTKIWETIGGVSRSLAVELAPWITEVASRFADWAKDGTKASSYISQGMDWILSGVGLVADAVQVASAAWKVFEAAGMNAVRSIMHRIADIGDSINSISKYFGGDTIFDTSGLRTWSAALQDSMVQAFDQAGEIWSKPWASETARQLVDDITVAAEGRAGQAVAQAKKFRAGSDLGDIETSGKKLAAVKAVEFGSQEAANTILRTAFGGGSQKELPKIAKNTERQAVNSDVMIGLLSAIAEDIGKDPYDVWNDFKS